MEEIIDINQEILTAPIMAAKPMDTEQVGSKYPYYPLSAAMKIAEAVKDLGGARSPVKKSLLARQLGAVENSAAFAQQLASARAFGVIEGRGDSTLTELAKKYYFPTAESDKSIAYLGIFATPTAFAGLLKRFDGAKLPTREILGNILHRDLGVPESWKDRVAALFSNSAQNVGVIDSQGFIRFDAALHSAAVQQIDERGDDDEEEGLPPTPPVVSAPQGSSRSIAAKTVHWRFKSIEVTTPEDMDRALWEKLSAYVQLLEPVEL